MRIYNNGSQLLRSLQTRLEQLEQNNQNSTLILNLMPETWTDFALVAEIEKWQALSVDGIDLTDSFEYRQFNSKWQIFSLTAQSNLQVILS